MANYNLTSQQLKDTYQQLVQVSGSAIVDGTGSLVNAFDYPSNSAYTTFSSSVAVTLNSIVAGSGSADWTLITNKPAGLVSSSAQTLQNLNGTNIISSSIQIRNLGANILSSSAQIATDISGAFTSTSASLAAGIATNKSDITTKLATSTFTSYSSSVSTRLTTDETNIATNTSNIATQTSRVDSLVSATSSYAVKSSNNVFTGTQTFNNIAVNGTASISHLQTVTGSAVIIGEEFIILNTAVPAARYAGMKVYDTGSTASTASFIFDGVTNDWFYEYSGSDATNYGVVLFGPEYGTIGTPSYPTSNVIQKGMGGHHLVDSNISDDGSQVSITGPVSASTYYGDGSNLTGVQSGLVAGTGTNSLRSALTSTPAVAAADLSIAIGNNVTVESLSTGMIAIGHDINGAFTNRDYSIAIGAGIVLENDGFESIAIGSGSRGEDYSVSVGAGASSTGRAISIGKNSTAGSDYGVAIGDTANATSTGTNPSPVAIGREANASGFYAVAIGYTSDAQGANSTAIGYDSVAGAVNTTAIGYSAYAGGVNATAIANSTANGVNAVSIGEGASAGNTNTTAFGVSANASGDEAVAIGTAYGATGNNSLGIGRRGTSSGDGSIAVGSLTEATANNAIAIGTSVTATSSNAINIGNVFKYDGTSTISLSGSLTGTMGAGGDVLLLNTSTATSGSRVIIGARDTWGAAQATGLNSILIGSSTQTVSNQLRAAGTYNVVIGGTNNQVTESVAGSVNVGNATIIGGSGNRIMASGSNGGSGASVLGGSSNRIERTGLAGLTASTIVGGASNRVSSPYSAIVSGDNNIISSSLATSIGNGNHGIFVGRNNKVDALDSSVILGGRFNGVSGSFAAVIAGATGSALHDRSVVIGGRSLSTTETDQVVVPNLLVSGQINSPVFSGSVASSTSSVDFNEGNFAVLTLTSATHIANPSNIKSGTTYTLIINSGSLAASYGTSFKFAGGTAPTLSNGVDILTMVSDGNSLFATGLANFL